MRVLVVTNLYPDPRAPQRGRFVRDQVEATRAAGVDVEVFSFPPGKREYLPAARRLREHLGSHDYDLVHAHYGLAGWCAARAGARPLLVTFHGTDVRHRLAAPLSQRAARSADLVAAVSRSLFDRDGLSPGLPRDGTTAVLPCGPDLGRFRRSDRSAARRELGLDPEGRFLFFPADPARPEKRHDRAAELADACGAELLTGGRIDPERMPLWVNAANAVVVTSEREGFGLAALEALACDVAVLSTPVGVAPLALAGVHGCLVAPFDRDRWARAARPHLSDPGSRVRGAARAEELSAGRMAARVIEAYRGLLEVTDAVGE